MDINTRREGAKGMEQDSFQWCPVTGPGAEIEKPLENGNEIENTN